MQSMIFEEPDKKLKYLPPQKDVIRTTRKEESIKYVNTYGVLYLKGATDITKMKVREIICSGLINDLGWREIAKNLEKEIDEGGEFQRNWYRVAITESSSALNNGYLATKELGSYVIGQGNDNNCKFCKKWIIGKVYRITEKPSVNFEDIGPLSNQYRDLVNYYENFVWVGKNNGGRSSKLYKLTKNGDFIPRLRHEIYFPTLPLHQNCRCMWLSFNPELMYADDRGQFIPKKRNPESWEEWIDKNITSRYG